MQRGGHRARSEYGRALWGKLQPRDRAVADVVAMTNLRATLARFAPGEGFPPLMVRKFRL